MNIILSFLFSIIALSGLSSSPSASGPREPFRFTAENITISLDKKGYFASISVCGEEVLCKKGTYPLIAALSKGEVVLPVKMSKYDAGYCLSMSDGGQVNVKMGQGDVDITLTITSLSDTYDAVMISPVKVKLHEAVGDVIGVARGNGLAFGIQALNIKTNAGIPAEYGEAVQNKFISKGKGAELSVGTVPDYRLAAVNTTDGASFQFSCRRRDRVEYRQVQQLHKSLVLPVEGEDALISGASVAFFGVKSTDALRRIGEIEIAHGLPHPMFDGEWGKTSRRAMRSYLITEFAADELDFVLDKAEIAGWKYIYHSDPFKTWGHFEWNPDFVTGGDGQVKEIVEKASQRGIAVGIHTLSNFMTTNDDYVTPVPSAHLLKQGILTLASDIDDNQTDIPIIADSSILFEMPMTLNAVQVGNELITYGGVNYISGGIVLTSCSRGAFGTSAQTHSTSEVMYKLWDYPYRTLFPDIVLQDAFADRLVEIFNNTGLSQISFDGLEGCTYTGQDDYATARFVSRCYQGWNHNVLNDASNLNHYTWHINTRMNWGEPWGEAMRTGQVENRIKNQDFFARNLFPRMLGWFLIRLSDKKFECTTLEDLEWALSESAGFDAGYAMTVSMKTMKGHGEIDKLLETIKIWDSLRENDCFSDELKMKLREPATEWHLERKNDTEYLLYPLQISKHFVCDFSEMQPGQSGGSDWVWDVDHTGNYAFRLKVEGEGSISNPQIRTALGTVVFPCIVSEDEYLIYNSDGKAYITDKNFNHISDVIPQGVASISSGNQTISFSSSSSGSPEVNVRFIIRGKPYSLRSESTGLAEAAR